MWQFFHPFTFWTIQPLLESIYYDIIDSLGLSVPLWIGQSRVPILNTQFTTVPSKSFTIKLKPIIRDEDVRDLKLSDNIFPYKSLDVYISDIWQGLSFNPFGEVISADQ